MASLAEIRARLAEQAQKSGGTNATGTGDNAIFAHWNIPEGSSATIRFLPDSDDTNTFFWRERQMIRIPFAGVKGQDENKKVVVQVPCIEMWGETCPVHATIRPWFKDPNMESLGRTYWKKRSYVFQGFVVNSPVDEQSLPENPVRRFIISPQIFTLIKQALMDPEMEELPTDYQRGTDFRINKTQKGGYADYSTSGWARKERGLNETELQAIATHGLFNLNDFMPKRPGIDETRAIMEMFEASVAGELYDADRWGKMYRPSGVQIQGATGAAADADEDTLSVKAVARASAPAPAPAPAPKAEVTATASVADTATPSGEKPSVDDILKMIRNRQK
jgi:hypothetical protein